MDLSVCHFLWDRREKLGVNCNPTDYFDILGVNLEEGREYLFGSLPSFSCIVFSFIVFLLYLSSAMCYFDLKNLLKKSH